MRYIKERLMVIDGIMMVLGIFASTVVALGIPQPYFWFAFPAYMVLAILGIVSNYARKSPLVWMFGYFMIIDTIGVYRWWPW